MTVRIVTDSSCDLPKNIADELDITVVPLYVQVAGKTYRDGIDISPQECFDILEQGTAAPTTAAASPHDFAETYRRLCHDCDSIISVHLSGKVSNTLDAAKRGKEMVGEGNCRIDVVDSRLVSIALGLLSIAAARAARAGQGMQEILDYIGRLIPSIRVFGMLDTLKYVVRSGRLGKAGTLLSSVLPVKPILTMKEGVVAPAGAVRTRSKGIERLYDIVRSAVDIREIGIAHCAVEDEIRAITERLKALAPNVVPVISSLGPALSVHGGPGTILVAIEQAIAPHDDSLKKHIVSLPSLSTIRQKLSQRMQRDTSSPFQYAFNPVKV